VSSKDQQRNNVYQHLQKSGIAQDDEGTIASNSLMTTPSGNGTATRSSNQQSMAHQHINQSI
jgi:hypothetical protein